VAVNVNIVVDVRFSVRGSSTVASESKEAGSQLYVNGLPPVTLASKVVVVPYGILESVPASTIGKPFTVTADVVPLHPVLPEVKVKVALPAPTPVTIPSILTVATPSSLLNQLPPVSGDKLVVLPAHIILLPVMLTAGNGLTVTTTADDTALVHPLPSITWTV
jgi:hypothetical protein